jgi:hypothetical protein
MSFTGYSRYQAGLISTTRQDLSSVSANISTLNDNISSSKAIVSTIESGKLNAPEYLLLHSSLTLFNTTASGRADTIIDTKLSLAEYTLKISTIGVYNAEQDGTLSTLANTKLNNTLFNNNTSTIVGNSVTLTNRVSTIENVKFDWLVHSTMVNTLNASNTILDNSLTAIETNKVDSITFNSAVSTLITADNALTLRADDIDNRKLNVSTYNGVIALLENNDITLTSSITTVESVKLLSSVYNTNVTRLDGLDSTINNSVSFLSTSLNNRISGVDTSISSIQSTITSINNKINFEVMTAIQSKVSASTFSGVTSTLMDINTEQFSTLETKVVSTVQSLVDAQQQEAIGSKVSIIEYNTYKSSRDSDYVSTISTFSGKDSGYSTKLLAIDEYIITTLKTYEVDAPNGIYTYTGVFQNMINLYPPTTSSSVPSAPAITAVTPGAGSVTVAFSTPNNGGATITGYTVTSSGGQTASGASSPIIVSGLTNGTSYTFTVVATNANGSSDASTTSASVVPSTVPSAPTIITVTPGSDIVTVAFSTPNNGGATITGYTVTSSGGQTASGASSPIIVSGLTSGLSYTFTIVANNVNGSSVTSSTSTSVVPFITFTPVWGNWLDGPSLDLARSVVVSDVGDVYVAASASDNLQSSVTTVIGTKVNTSGSLASSIVKYNSTGIAQLGTWLDGTGNDSIRTVKVDSSDNIYVVGFIDGALQPALTAILGSKPHSSPGGYLIKYNSSLVPEWGRWLDGTTTDNTISVAIDTVGSVYVCGFSSGDMQSSLVTLMGSKPGGANQGAYIIKYSSSGVTQWGRWLDGTTNDLAVTLATDSLNNVYIGGHAGGDLQASFVTLMGSKPGGVNQGAYIIKYSSAGDALWGRWLDGTGTDFNTLIAVDNLDNVYVTGYTNSSLQSSFNSTLGLKSAAGQGGYIVKYNSSGVVESGRWLDGSADDHCLSIATDSVGNVYVAGHTSGTLQTALSTLMGARPSGGNGAFIVKYNSSLLAQAGVWLDGTGSDINNTIIVDKFNDIYVTGQSPTNFQSSLLTLMGAKPGGTTLGAFVVKYNSSLVPQWATWLDGPGDDIGYSVASDSLGNVYITGTSFSGYQSSLTSLMGPKPETTGGGLLINYNSSGNIQWGSWVDGSTGDQINGMARDSSGNIYVTGFSSGNLQTSLTTLFGSRPGSSGAAFIIKYNSSGSALWGTWLDGPAFDQGGAIEVDASGNIYVTGVSAGDLQASLSTLMGAKPGAATNGGFVIKYNSAGTALWGNWIDGSGTEGTHAIAVDASGNVYVSGVSNGDLQASLVTLMGAKPGAATNGGFVIKYSSSGTALWGKWIDGSGDDRGFGIAVDSLGNAYVTGLAGAELQSSLVTVLGPKQTTAVNNDAFLIKYSPAGTVLWGRWIDGLFGNDQGNYVAVDKFDNIYVAGTCGVDLPTYVSALIGNKLTGTNSGAVILRFNSSGVFQGGAFLDSPSGDGGQSVAVDGSGNAYLCGVLSHGIASNYLPALASIMGTKPNGTLTQGGFIIKYSMS